jgi:hypothetical protein
MVKMPDGRDRAHFPSHLTWPALYASRLGYDYECHALPGIGNLQITDRILCNLSPDTLYFINWTWIDRFDYTDPLDNYWQTISPSNNSDSSTYYYRNLHSQLRDKLTSLISIKLVIDTLNQYGFPFIMTYMDELLFEDEWHTSDSIINLQNSIRPFMKTFDGMSFLNWSKYNNYPIGEKLHPLTEAHQQAANYLLNLV